MDMQTLAHFFILTIHRVFLLAPVNITHVDINARNVVQALNRRNGNRTLMLVRLSANLATVMDIQIGVSMMMKLMKNICHLISMEDTMEVEFVRIVVTTLKASTVMNASRDIIDPTADIGMKLTFVILAIAIISIRLEIALKRLDIANAVWNSKLQIVIHVQRDILAIRIVDHANVI